MEFLGRWKTDEFTSSAKEQKKDKKVQCVYMYNEISTRWKKCIGSNVLSFLSITKFDR